MSGLVFICHNSKDKPVVRAICDVLRQNGIPVWIDEDSIPQGVPWYRYLFDRVDDFSVALIFLGPHGLGRIQEQEVERVLRKFEAENKSIIPVLLPGFRSEAPQLSPYIREQLVNKWNYIDLTFDRDAQVKKLVRGLLGKPDLSPVGVENLAMLIPDMKTVAQGELGFVVGWVVLHVFGYIGITSMMIYRRSLHYPELMAVCFTLSILAGLMYLGWKQLSLRKIDVDQAGGIVGSSVAVFAVAMLLLQAPGDDGYIRPIGALATAIGSGLLAGWVAGWQAGVLLAGVASAVASVAASLSLALEEAIAAKFGRVLLVGSAGGAMLWSFCLAQVLVLLMRKPNRVREIFRH